MSLKVGLLKEIPEETRRVAKAVFSKGNRYLMLRDTFGDFFSAEDFQGLFHAEGRPAVDPGRLALITLLQFAENLSDERMAEAVRSRIDFKYLLALPLDDPGFDASVLCEFRTRLIEGRSEMVLFEKLIAHLRSHKLLRERGRQRTDSTHVLTAVHALNRINCVAQTFRHTLNILASVAPDWFRKIAKPEWVERYSRRFDLEHQVPESKKAERELFETTLAADGLYLLRSALAKTAPAWLNEVPAVQILWRVWIQNFTWAEGETLRFRTSEEIPPGRLFIGSPHDLDARYSQKRSSSWVGYKVHLTETCEEDLPMLITNVETTPATTPDFDVTKDIHDALDQRNLLPNQHLVDMGFLSANLLVSEKKDHQVDLIGPARHDQRWQAFEGKGFAAEHFRVDWDAQILTCPAGRKSLSWSEAFDRRNRPVAKIKFAIGDCRDCPLRSNCTKAPRRTVTLQARETHQTMLNWRFRETTDEFKLLYAKRAGIEGTISLGTRVFGIRRSRYFGFFKTRLQHLVTASAINLIRVADWLLDKPRATTRIPAFERVLASVA
jgi:transposase